MKRINSTTHQRKFFPFFILAVLLTQGSLARAQSESDYVAKMGTWMLSVEEFQSRLINLQQQVPDYDIQDPAVRKMVVEELVRQELLYKEALQQGLMADKDIKIAVDLYQKNLLIQQLSQKVIKNVSVTEDEVQAFYDENKDQMREEIQWSVSEIVVKDQLKASELSVSLLKGDDFSELAKKHSISPTAEDGGKIGFLQTRPSEALLAVLLPLEIGDVSPPFRGPEGFYIIRLDDKMGGEPILFEKIKDRIIQQLLYEKRQQKLLSFIDDLKTKSDLKVNENLIY